MNCPLIHYIIPKSYPNQAVVDKKILTLTRASLVVDRYQETLKTVRDKGFKLVEFIFFPMPGPGLEPGTRGFSVLCSTN